MNQRPKIDQTDWPTSRNSVIRKKVSRMQHGETKRLKIYICEISRCIKWEGLTHILKCKKKKVQRQYLKRE